jgi:hypothetical protein
MPGYRLARLQPKQFPVEFDDRDKAIVSYVARNELTMVSEERLFATVMACRHVCAGRVDGDFVECGVWRGGNALIAADVFSRLSPDRKVYLLDTFSGMTQPGESDVSRTGTAGEEGWCAASIEEVRASFAARGLLANVVFVKGDVGETLRDPRNLPAHISVLRLDTDWYESTRLELEILYPLLRPGGVLMVDDYGYWQGARKAVDEYFSAGNRPFFHYVDHTGRAAIKPR